jgi:prepilin-type N-terminal cleavage/methylation domain-containing protein
MMRIEEERGFTLNELVIVVAIIGILSTMAIPSFQGYMAKNRLKGAARMVFSDLMAAKMKAVTLNQKVKVSFGGQIYRIWNDADSDGTVAENEGDNLQRDIHIEYYDVTLTASANPIFHPRGTAALGGTVKVTNPLGSKYVIVALNGRVRISDTPP